MRLQSDQLAAHLAKKSLAPVYAIHGDEPLLVLEAADAVRAAARKQGFADREVYEAGRSFDWSELAHAGASLSLFGGRKVVELRLPSGKPAPQAADALVAWCANPNPDTLLLVTMPRPEGGGWWEAPWFLALNKAGVVVEAQPVPRGALPAWLAKRLAAQKQSAPAEALEYLAERVEGNLLAAHQEVQKLALLAPEGELSLDTVRGAVADVARYDTNDAAEALLAGDTARYLRVLQGLRGEGEAPTYLLFTVSTALFALSGSSPYLNKAMQRIVGAAKRYRPQAITRAIAHAAGIDRAIKGVGAGEPWEEFAKLGLELHAGA